MEPVEEGKKTRVLIQKHEEEKEEKERKKEKRKRKNRFHPT